MEIIENIEQSSPEWHEIRRGVITASRFKDVMAKGAGKTRKSYMVELAAEVLANEVVSMEPNKYMQWGTETEPMARDYYEIVSDNTVKEVAFVKHGTLNCGVSPDGLIDANGGIEIKCPKTTTQIETFLSGKMPTSHKAQVQGCLWVSGRDFWDFVSFDPRIDGEAGYFIERIYRDEEYIKELEAAVIAFDEELQQMILTLKG